MWIKCYRIICSVLTQGISTCARLLAREKLLRCAIFICRYLQDHQVDDTGSELNYGAGKSKFYAASDRGSHASVSKLLPTNTNKDYTLYLSRYNTAKWRFSPRLTTIIEINFFLCRSTFYNDQTSSTNVIESETWNNSDNSKVLWQRQ